MPIEWVAVNMDGVRNAIRKRHAYEEHQSQPASLKPRGVAKVLLSVAANRQYVYIYIYEP